MQANGVDPGARVRRYLRPEDRYLPDTGDLQALRNQLSGVVRSIEFLGSYWLAEVEVDRFEGQRLLVYYSLNQVHQYGIRAGSVVPFALRGERVRVFGAAGG